MGISDDNGNKVIYAEPGSYTVCAEKTDENFNTLISLSKKINIQLDTENIIPITWADFDTGDVSFNLGTPADGKQAMLKLGSLDTRSLVNIKS